MHLFFLCQECFLVKGGVIIQKFVSLIELLEESSALKLSLGLIILFCVNFRAHVGDDNFVYLE